MKNYLLLICLIVTLPAYAIWGKNPTGKKYEPVVNAHPTHFVQLVINTIPSKNLPHSLTLFSYYETTNDKCRITTNWLEGSRAGRSKYKLYKVDLTKPSTSLKIPLDYYLPGKCQWDFYNINVKNDSFYNSLMLFEINKQSNKINQGNISLKFVKGRWAYPNLDYTPILTPRNNYTFNLTIEGNKR